MAVKERGRRQQPPQPRDLRIECDSIRLGQLLKLTDAVRSGSDVKPLLATGTVHVNGEPETRRGRQVRKGDVVEFGNVAVHLT